MTMQMKVSVLAMASALLASGCAVDTPPADMTVPALPAQWVAAGLATDAAGAVQQDWWRSFGSAELDALVERARAQSHDLAAAVARVGQAEAVARAAGAASWPALTGQLNASREGRIDGHASVAGTAYGTGLAASYEIDFWGRQRADREGASASLQASVFDRDTVRLSVTAGVANAWLEAVSLRERAAIGERQWRGAERLLALVESRVRAGAALPLEQAQQRGLVAAQRRSVEALRQASQAAETAVALLIGQAGGVAIGTASLAALRVPPIDAGLPAELLVRRPDIARAEARLVAAQADVAAARAALLPSVTLNAGIGSGGERLRHVWDNPVYALAVGLAAPIFDAGRLAASRDQALAQREELLAGYRAAIVAAFGDTANALNTLAGVDAQARAQADELVEAQRALTLAESRYRAGADTLLTLIDAQRTLYAAQDVAAQLRAQRLQASVALYKALGGGWSRDASTVTAARATAPTGVSP